MLNSRHVFIQQGALTSNDNGRKKFNKSEMRYEDEQILKWVSHVNDRLLESASMPKAIFLFCKREGDILHRYTQLEHFSFERKIAAENISEMRDILEKTDVEAGACFVVAGNREEISVHERVGVNYHYLYDITLQCVLETDIHAPVLPEVRDELRKRTFEKIKKVNEALEKVSSAEKVLVYGGGYQTEAFLRYTNINRLNIIGVVDRKCLPVFNIAAKATTYENIRNADVIVITPYYAAEEIKRYLAGFKLDSRVICIADLCGDVLFTGQENIWAPDLEQRETDIAYDREKERLLEAADEVNRSSPCFVIVKENAAYDSHIPVTEKLLEFERNTALVIQGPVIRKQNFTFNTIKLYRENFPHIKLILSVWEEDWEEDDYEKVSKFNVEIVRGKKPPVRGYQNVNLQLGTSWGGLKRAKETGCRYAFKTRSDMRFYSPELVALMYIYMQKFPLKRKGHQSERLVIFPPRYDYYFFIQDFFMFGNTDDMLHYWDASGSFANDYAGESAETMLGIRYAELIGERIENRLDNISEYDRVIKDYFAVVDDKMLDFIWYKYFYNKLWECEYHYNSMNFVDWLSGQETEI